MQSMTHAASTRRHLSRHERQREARALAFSRRSRTVLLIPSPVRLAANELELIDRLVRHDRTAVSTALLAVAGIGAGEMRRQAVLSRIAEAAASALAKGAISSHRAEEIARHVKRALGHGNQAAA